MFQGHKFTHWLLVKYIFRNCMYIALNYSGSLHFNYLGNVATFLIRSMQASHLHIKIVLHIWSLHYSSHFYSVLRLTLTMISLEPLTEIPCPTWDHLREVCCLTWQESPVYPGGHTHCSTPKALGVWWPAGTASCIVTSRRLEEKHKLKSICFSHTCASILVFELSRSEHVIQKNLENIKDIANSYT